MRESTAQHLLKKVQFDYNQIAEEFSDTRKYGWEEFHFFKKYLIPDAKIVDLGCGNGRFLQFLYQHYLSKNFDFIGIDNSENLLKQAHKLYPEAVFLPGDQLNIPLDNNSSDLIFCIAAFHHLPSRNLRLNALLEMERVLKPGGKVILTVWNLWQRRYLKAIISAFLRSLFTFFDYAPNDLLIAWKKKVHRYYHAFLPFELINLIKHSNFKIIEQFGADKDQKTTFLKSRNYCLVLQKK